MAFRGLFGGDEFAVDLEVEDFLVFDFLPPEEAFFQNDVRLVGHFVAGFADPEFFDGVFGVVGFDVGGDGEGEVVFDDVVGFHAAVGEDHGLGGFLVVEVVDFEGVFVDLVPLDVGGFFDLALEVFDVGDFDVLLGDFFLSHECTLGEEECGCDECYLFHI